MPCVILSSPRRLEKTDYRADFDCLNNELNVWLQQFSWQNQRAHNAVTYVTVADAPENHRTGSSVYGYYALAAAAVEKVHTPVDFARGRPAHIPCVLLARLAVDKRVQGRGVGAALLRDAIARVFTASRDLGVAALLVHCADSNAKNFYLRNADFLEVPHMPLTLLLPIAAISEAS